MMRHVLVVAMATSGLMMMGCDGGGGTDAGSTTPDSSVTLMDGGPGVFDAGPGVDSGPMIGDDAGGGGTDAGGGGIDAGGGTDSCTPMTCGASDCGMIADGCGATIDCGPCNGTGVACTMDSDCMSGDCAEESETGWYQGYCGADCRVDSECGTGGHCAFTRNALDRIGRCVLDCTSDADCRGPEYTCHQADMFGPSECAPVGTGSGAIGEACASNADCGGGEDWLCLREAQGFLGGMCSLSCAIDGDCGAGNHCGFIPAGGGEGVCLPNCTSAAACRAAGYVCTNADDDLGSVDECFPGGTGTGTVGSACDGVWDCALGEDSICLGQVTSGTLGGYCSALCMADGDCGTDAHCSDYPTADGGTIGICQANCTSDADCRSTGGYGCYDDNDDMVTECYVAGTGAGAVGASCSDTGDCDGAGRGRCSTNVQNGYCFLTDCTLAGGAGADCPTGSHCSINNDPMTMVPAATGICVADCASDVECPMMGQRCYESGDVDMVLECLPAATGTGGIGDYCTDTYECGGEEFGFCLLDLDNTGGLPDFPGGSCTQFCGGTNPPCPGGSTCLGNTFCVQDCTMGSDCRPGTDYSCVVPPLMGVTATACWPS